MGKLCKTGNVSSILSKYASNQAIGRGFLHRPNTDLKLGQEAVLQLYRVSHRNLHTSID